MGRPKKQTAGKTAKVTLLDDGKNKVEMQEVKKDRVVLALSTEQAEQLNKYFLKHGGEVAMLKLQQRIERTLTKQRIMRENPNFTKEQIQKALEVATK